MFDGDDWNLTALDGLQMHMWWILIRAINKHNNHNCLVERWSSSLSDTSTSCMLSSSAPPSTKCCSLEWKPVIDDKKCIYAVHYFINVISNMTFSMRIASRSVEFVQSSNSSSIHISGNFLFLKAHLFFRPFYIFTSVILEWAGMVHRGAAWMA